MNIYLMFHDKYTDYYDSDFVCAFETLGDAVCNINTMVSSYRETNDQVTIWKCQLDIKREEDDKPEKIFVLDKRTNTFVEEKQNVNL